VDDLIDTSGTLLRRARINAGLSQTEVARRAHVAQSVISAYESDRREPALSTLAKLAAAAGHRLVVSLQPDLSMRPGLPDTPLGRRLRRHRAAVLRVAQRRGATNLRVFGSVARGQDTVDSDIDLMVDLAPDIGLISLAALERELSEVLRAKVDVVPADSLRPGVKAEADAESIPL
jgi:predicted nucleotidyltransferase/DNA-binding XRE family transcriptional regulator